MESEHAHPVTLLEHDAPRTFVFGDIHGCFEEIERMLNYLTKTVKVTEVDRFVFLGDYVDRGPNARRVIDTIIDWRAAHPDTFCLRGNHEVMFQQALEGVPNEAELETFLSNGGATTLRNYEIDPGGWSELPTDHQQFLQSLHRYVVTPQYIFVHAGLNPLRDVVAQFDEDLFWIREPFIMNVHYFKRLVIFGHTPFERPLIHRPYKVGIDTGVVFGNKLTCLELPSGAAYQIKRGGKRVKKSKLGI